MNISLTVVGLVFDILGALTLGWAYATSRDSAMFQWVEVSVDAPGTRIAAERRWDARIGVVLLVFGFAFQIADDLGAQLQSYANISIIVAGAIAFFMYLAFRRRLVIRDVNKIERLRAQLQ